MRDGEEVDAETLDESGTVKFEDARSGDILNVSGFSEGEFEYRTDRDTDPQTPRSEKPGHISDSIDIL